VDTLFGEKGCLVFDIFFIISLMIDGLGISFWNDHGFLSRKTLIHDLSKSTF